MSVDKILFMIFIVLKVTNLTELHWAWVFSPIWIVLILDMLNSSLPFIEKKLDKAIKAKVAKKEKDANRN